MTQPASDRRKEYAGNDTTTVFAGPRAFSASHIAVYEVDDATDTATLTTAYTLTGTGGRRATTVTMDTAPATGTTLLILRTVPYTQDTDITNQGPYLPETVEQAMDALAQQIQQLDDRDNRTIRLADTVTGVTSAEVTSITPLGPVVVNADGTGFEVGDTELTGDMLLRAHLGAGTDDLFTQSGTGAVVRGILHKLRERISVEDFGAVGDGVTDDTDAIQAAIDAVHAAGGGDLWFGAKEYIVTRSALTDVFDSGTTAADVCALLWRSGVYLRGRGMGATTIHCTDTASTVIASYSMESGGIADMTIRNDSTGATGAGHGVLLSCAAGELYNKNLTFRNIESCYHGSYGIAAQKGDYSNNLYDGIYVHDVGADGIDHKVRSGDSPISRGVRFSNIFCERFGQRVDDSAGIDVRGPATITNFHAREFGKTGFTNWGLRFNAGTDGGTGTDTREPSNYSSLSNFFIESSPEFDTGGITINNAQSIEISNGTIVGTIFRGVRVGVVSSGLDVGRNVSVSNVQVIGVRDGIAFIAGWERVRWVNCISRGEVHEFKEVRNNLTAGQTVFEADFDPATVQVYKNGGLLTGGGVDYTATGSTTITLTAGVLITDVIEVVTPNAIGFQVESGATWCSAYLCGAQHTTSPFIVNEAETFGRLGNISGTSGFRFVETTSPRIEAYGTDTNLDLRLDAKGTGRVRFGTRTANADAPITGYIEVKDTGGTVRKLAIIA